MMMSSNDVDHHKVPIWIGTDCKLVSGINKSTTCQNVIQSLVRTENPSKFVIVEKWKKMERRLDPNVRILKVWKAWGDQKDDVALILRHHHSTDGYIDKRISNKVLRRNKSSQHHKLANHDENTEEVEVTEPMERLLKLVLTQGETIQVQLKKLRHQEEQIERYEEQMHRMRSLQEGENYVVDSYLRDDKGKKSRKRDKSPRKVGWLKQQQQQHHPHQHHPHSHQHQNQNRHQHQRDPKDEQLDSGSSNPNPNPNPNSNAAGVQIRSDMDDKSGSGVEEDIHEKSEIMERICDLNCKLTKEEEHLVKLGLKIKKYYERHKVVGSSASGGDGGSGSGNGGSGSNSGNLCSEERYGPSQKDHVEDQVFEPTPEEDEDMRQLMSQLETLRDITSEQFSEIELNEQSLNELEQLLDSKHDHVAHLTYQIQLVDEESEHLRQRLLKISQGFPPHPHHYPHSNQHHLQHPLQHQNQHQNQHQHHHQLQNPYQHNPHPHPHPHSSHLSPILTASPSSFPSASSQGQHLNPALAITTSNLTHSHSSSSNAVSSGPISSMSGSGLAGGTGGLGGAASSEMIIGGDKMIGHANANPSISMPLPNTTSVSSKNNPSSLAVDTAAGMSFGCQHSEIIPSTHLNLHMKPCRDHQDNDSNSDTGISSLHSSSDENTLFVLDTLV